MNPSETQFVLESQSNMQLYCNSIELFSIIQLTFNNARLSKIKCVISASNVFAKMMSIFSQTLPLLATGWTNCSPVPNSSESVSRLQFLYFCGNQINISAY